MRVAPPISLNSEQRKELERASRSRSVPARLVERARIVLWAADGWLDKDIAAKLGITPEKASRWRRRFREGGMEALRKDAPRPGRPRTVPASKVKSIIEKTTQQKPDAATHWSTRSMAAAVGVSEATVRRVWRAHGLKPHLVKRFKISSDPHFAEKLEAIVGLYLNPPEQAVVLCCDEKCQIQALQRSQPGLPLGKGHIRTQTHDYYRNGTVTLFAALDYLEGKVIAHTAQKHTHRQWLEFLKHIDREIPLSQRIHIILDNYSTHKHQVVKRWLARHPRFELHFTPTGSSWMNLVERFFRDLSQQAILPGSFGSVRQLVDAIMEYLAQHNLNPKRYVWKAKGEEILAKIERAWKAALGEEKDVTIN